jgi:hypothetical protein
MTAILVIEALAIVLLSVLVVGLLRSHAEILRALHELGAGEAFESEGRNVFAPRPLVGDGAATDITGLTLSGSSVHIGVTGTTHATMLAFLSTTCSACIGLWEGLGAGNVLGDLRDVRLVVVTKGPEAESPSRLGQLAPDGITLVQSTEAWEAYGVPVSPYFILVDGATDEITGSGSAGSWAQVTSLLGQALADARAVHDGAVGEMAADAELRRAGIGPGHPSLYPEAAPIKDDG